MHENHTLWVSAVSADLFPAKNHLLMDRQVIIMHNRGITLNRKLPGKYRFHLLRQLL
jgi:hypothetical protein